MKRKIGKRTTEVDELQAGYDPAVIRGGVRGKYVDRYLAGNNLVLLAPDVAVAFPNAAAVNEALRCLMQVAKRCVTVPPEKQP